ncbi:hypothetical protein ACFRCW_39585 [Streptomyces sp. NPDC056653]|uniref:hypothetical protein n=1 Tax=Streptomyces sp. NPDC056653 TaxID=3345894 RepID=UPI0036A2B5AD
MFFQSTHSTPMNHRTRSYGLILCKPLGPAGKQVQLPSNQRKRLLQVLAGLAEAEEDPARRQFLESFPFAIGMTEDQERAAVTCGRR